MDLRLFHPMLCSEKHGENSDTFNTLHNLKSFLKFRLFDPPKCFFLIKEICEEMELVCVPLNAAVEGSSKRVHLALIKAVNYHFVYPAAQTWSALSKEKPVEEY